MISYDNKCPKCGGYAIMIMVWTTGGSKLKLVCLNPKTTGCPT
jgi:hypothetical protein